ncbi:hypothetical protein MBLNU459_g4044t2 [Dothideomycetes sp. NU459]
MRPTECRRRDLEPLSTTAVFPSQAIHGIVVYETGIIVWGGCHLALFDLLSGSCKKPSPRPRLRAVLEATDWILDVSVSPQHDVEASSEQRTATLITAHNALLLLDLDSSADASPALFELTSNSKCILYSAHLFWLSPSRVLVASGTVFGEIIVWSCIVNGHKTPESTLHQVLVGHDGSIFGVQIFETTRAHDGGHPLRLLASCSDDRTIRIWDITVLPDTSASPQAAADISSARETGFGTNVVDLLSSSTLTGRCVAQAWGHASRIWGVRFVPSHTSDVVSHLVSFGEDATCQFWRLTASSQTTSTTMEPYALSHLRTTAVHAGKNIWSSALSAEVPNKITIASGGADGSILLESTTTPFQYESESVQSWSIDDLVAAIPEHARSTKQDKLRNYAFVESVDLLVTTDSGNVLLLGSQPTHSSEPARRQKNWKWVSHVPSLRGYSVVASIPTLSVGFLAGIDGTVFTYDSSGIRHLTKCSGKVSTLLARAALSRESSQPTRKLATLLVTTVESRTALLMLLCIPTVQCVTQEITVVREWQIELPTGFIVMSSIVANDNTTLILGSRNGALASFPLQTEVSKGSAPSIAHNLLLDGAHGRDAITDLEWIASPLSNDGKSFIFSVGRDGSHAHEEDVPGTVNLQVLEGDDSQYGQALFPVPSDDPNDPLQWPNWKKTTILVICSLYSFFGNSALLGPSVYLEIYAKEFDITVSQASGLVSYPNLCYGFGSLLLVPAYLKLGRRPVMLFSMLLFAFGLLGASRATSFSGLMAARIIHAIGSGVCEALPVQLVNDVFFLHERGRRIGYYTVCLCWGSTGPLYAGYMLAGGYSWRLYFYVEFAFACALLILAFLFVEETSFKRQNSTSPESADSTVLADDKSGHHVEHVERVESIAVMYPPRRPFLQTLKPWSGVDHDAALFLTMGRSFTYFLVPSVLWVVTSFGIYIGLGALAFNYTFPILVTSAPYNWDRNNAGLIALGNLVGYALAVPFASSSDRLAARLTKKNGGIREAEMRLGVLLPAVVVAPAGLVVYGLTAEHKLHWFGYFAGVAMVDWGSLFFFSFTLAYAVDSYQANTSEMLIAMNVGKQAISFGMG